MNREMNCTMICIVQAATPPIICRDLLDAARMLIVQDMKLCPEVKINGETVIRMNNWSDHPWSLFVSDNGYIPGTWYALDDYETKTQEARKALELAWSLRDIDRMIDEMAYHASVDINKDCANAKRMINWRFFVSTVKLRNIKQS